MKIKIKIFTEKNGYSLDITGPRNGLILQRSSPSLMEISELITDYVNMWSDPKENAIDAFVERNGVSDPSAYEKAADIYQRFRDWSEERVGRRPMSVTMFGRLFGKRFEKRKINGVIMYRGFQLFR